MSRFNVEMPLWFHRQNYKGVREMDLKKWFYNLVWRANLLPQVANMSDDEKYYVNVLYGNISSLVDGDGPFPLEIDFPSYIDDSNTQTVTTPTVWSLTLKSVFRWISGATTPETPFEDWLAEVAKEEEKITSENFLDFYFDDEHLTHINQPIDEIQRQFWRPETKNLTAAEQGFNEFETNYNVFNVMVDLNAPDNIILDDFKNWLVAARKRFDVRRTKLITEKEIASWRRYKILQYLDLTIWAMCEGGEFSDSDMGNILFPDEDGIDFAERIRKVVRRKALWLVNRRTLNAIYTQVSES